MAEITPDVFMCIFTTIDFLDIQSFLKIILMHKVFNFMMVLQGIQTMLGYLQFAICSFYFGKIKSDTLKRFSVTTNEDYPQQKYLSQNNFGKIYHNKLKDGIYCSVLLLGLVSVDCGISYQCLIGSTYWVFTHKLKGTKMLFIGAVTFVPVPNSLHPMGMQRDHIHVKIVVHISRGYSCKYSRGYSRENFPSYLMSELWFISTYYSQIR